MTLRFLLPLFVVAGLSGPLNDCDLKTIEAGFFCENCDALHTSKTLVSNATYFACAECDAISPKAGNCEECEVALTKKASGKNVCPGCFQKPQAADHCVKSVFACPKCSHEATAKGNCAKCEVALVARESRALVTYECSECALSAHKPGKCTDEDCDRHGKPLDLKSCSESGDAPHAK